MANEVLWAEGRPSIPTATNDVSPRWAEGRPPVVWIEGGGVIRRLLVNVGL